MRLEVVVPEHVVVEARPTANLTGTWKRRKLRPEDPVLERLRIAFGVIMSQKIFDNPAQVLIESGLRMVQ
jgi:hypothetical protein